MSNVQETLSLWKTRLLDTSRRNRLLYPAPRRGHVQVVGPGADAIYAALVNEGRKLTFVPRYEQAGQEAIANPLAELDVSAAPVTEPVAPQETIETDSESIENADLFIEYGESEIILEDTAFRAIVLPSDPDGGLSETAVTETPPREPEPAAQTTTPARAVRTCELQTMLTETQFATTLYNLRSHARTALEEQGVNVLFISFGLLHWVEPTTHEKIASPLVLVPVHSNALPSRNRSRFRSAMKRFC